MLCIVHFPFYLVYVFAPSLQFFSNEPRYTSLKIKIMIASSDSCHCNKDINCATVNCKKKLTG